MKLDNWGKVIKIIQNDELLNFDYKTQLANYLGNNYDKMEIEEMTGIYCDCGSELICDICYQGNDQTKWVWHYTCPHCYKQKLEFLTQATEDEVKSKFNLK